MNLEIKVDKRFEIITGVIVAYLKYKPNFIEEYDWVELPNCDYVQDLVSLIDIKHYPKIMNYIENIRDCGWYSELYLYFDEDMNPLDYTLDKEVFTKGSVSEFQSLIKQLYDNTNLNIVFDKYQDEFAKIEKIGKTILPQNFTIKDLEQFYEMKEKKYNVTLSILANGGFGFQKDNILYYFRGVNFNGNQYEMKDFRFIICLFHEYSHSFINPLVDKYYEKFQNLDFLLKEAIECGLPNCYKKEKTILYEYFVRANSVILASKYVEKDKIEDELEWFNEMGFIYIEDIIALTKRNLEMGVDYENIFLNVLVPFINSVQKEI